MGSGRLISSAQRDSRVTPFLEEKAEAEEDPPALKSPRMEPQGRGLCGCLMSPLPRKKANSPGIWRRHLKTGKSILPAQQTEPRGELGLHALETQGFHREGSSEAPSPDSGSAHSQSNPSAAQIKVSSLTFFGINCVTRQRKRKQSSVRSLYLSFYFQ